jgi:hypothetical protein
MTKVNLQENFNRIFEELSVGTVSKVSKIAKLMGYTTTTQLHSVLNGDSLLSTKAIVSLIEKADVNPSYLFLGQGHMFGNDVDAISVLKKENQELNQRLEESGKMVNDLREVIQELKKRNDDLIDLSSAAIKYHQGKKVEEVNMEEKNSSVKTKKK